MRANGKTMRLVAQTLHEIQHRIIVPQRHDRFAGAIEFFLPCIAVHALRHANHGDIFHTPVSHDLAHSAHLPSASVDQQQIRPSFGFTLRIFLQKPFEATAKDLFHHAKIITRREVITLDVKFPVL